MRRHTDIYPATRHSGFAPLRRLVLLLAMVLTMATALADTWDGTTASSFAGGNGSAADPYQIATGAQLKLLQSKTTQDYLSQHYVLTDDIDLDGRVLGMIGNASSGNVTSAKMFSGTFDGKGHTISNLLINVNNISNANLTFGLFGYVRGATIRNLNLDGASVQFPTSGNITSFDIKLGLLAGAVAPVSSTAAGQTTDDVQATRIENIKITNSRIQQTEGTFSVVTIFVGGLIGDVASGLGGSTIMNRTSHTGSNVCYGPLIIRNILVDADIDLSGVSRYWASNSEVAKITQYNVGGILGRMRRGRFEYIPENTLFTGKIRAPHATVGPVWGMLRSNSNNTSWGSRLGSAWAGEVFRHTNSVDTIRLNSAEVTSAGVKYYPDRNRFYTNLKIHHDGNYVDVTSTVPSADGCINGTRAFSTFEEKICDVKSESDMSMFRGVNHGTYVADIQEPMSVFNTYSDGDNALCHWRLVQDGVTVAPRQFYFLRTKTITDIKVDISGIDLPVTYVWEYRKGAESPWTEVRRTGPTTTYTDVLNITPLPDDATDVRISLVTDDGPTSAGLVTYSGVIPLGVSGKIVRSTWKDFTLSISDVTSSTYTLRWEGKLHDSDTWETFRTQTGVTTLPSGDVYTASDAMDFSVSGNFDSGATFALNNPLKYEALRVVLYDEVTGKTLPTPITFALPVRVTVQRTSAPASGAYTFKPDVADGTCASPDLTLFSYKVSGIKRSDGSVVDDLVDHFPVMNGATKVTSFTFKKPDHYKEIVVTLISTDDGTAIASGSVAIDPVAFDPLTCKRNSYNEFYLEVDTRYNQTTLYTYRLFGIPKGIDPATVTDLGSDPFYALEAPNNVVGNSASELVYARISPNASTCPIDKYQTVRAVLCDLKKQSGTGYIPGDPILLEGGQLIYYDFPIDNVGVTATRQGTNTFHADVQSGEAYGSQHYKYRWEGKLVSTGDYATISGTGANVNVPDQSLCSHIRVTLLNNNSTEVYAQQADYSLVPVTSEIELGDASDFYRLTLDKHTDPSTGDMVYRATVSGDNGTPVYGAGTVNWDAEGNPSVSGNIPLEDGYFWNWEVSSDPAGHDAWEGTTISLLYLDDYRDIGQQSWIAPRDLSRYYRAAWCRILFQTDAEGNYLLDSEGNKIPQRVAVTDLLGETRYYVAYERLAENVIGPKNVVFVYNKERSDTGRAMSVTYPSSSGDIVTQITTFSGIDTSDKTRPEFPDGDDGNHGHLPTAAVRTLKRAYEILDADGTTDTNIIVVMGYYYSYPTYSDPNDIPYFRVGQESKFNKAATITGQWGNVINGGAINVTDRSNDTNAFSIGAPTAFNNILWTGYKDPAVTGTYDAATNSFTGSSILRFYCNLHDFTIADNVRIIGYTDAGGETLGQIDGTRGPHISIIGGMHNYDNAELPDRSTLRNSNPDYTTINVQSGCMLRLIAGARNTQLNPTSRNIFGSLEHPHRIKLNINITHSTNEVTNEVNRHEFTPDAEYDYDIGLVTGGQTDGSLYSENNIEITNGHIGRFISGNISFGRATSLMSGSSVVKRYPSDTFAGSTSVVVKGGNIDELYGGSLGRYGQGADGTDLVEAFFYGRSFIQIDGGTVNMTIYGAGGGGVSGVGFCDEEEHHTMDLAIPYYPAGSGTISYGSYDEIKADFDANPPAGWVTGESRVADFLPTFTPAFTYSEGELLEPLPLGTAQTEVLITGGTVNGDIYGGGHGYSSQVKSTYALKQAGYLFGNTKVTVKGDHAMPPVINGNIYGGGAGSDQYYKEYRAQLIKDGKTAEQAEALASERFGSVARVFGNTLVNLEHGIINGHVFGGSKGVERFPEIGTIFGNTTINVGIEADRSLSDTDTDADGPQIEGHVFGGCDFANIRFNDSDAAHVKSGSTNVNVMSGILGNCIFGGSWGSDGSDGRVVTTSYVAGSTHVNVSGGWFKTNPYVNDVDNSDGYRGFNIYGGGYLNSVVEGDAHVNVTHSLMYDSQSFMPVAENPNYWPGETDPKTGTVTKPYETPFQAHYMDVTFRHFCIYGGGFGEQTRVLNTHVTVDLPAMGKYAVAPDNFTLREFLKGQSFFDIAGGGYAGSVGYWAANTADPEHGVEKLTESDPGYYDEDLKYVGGDCNVVIKGYTYARKVIGGGFYGSCFNATTDIICGSLRQIYGGALLGYVHNHARLKVGNRWEDFLTEGVTEEEARRQAYDLNKYIYVTENMYGGNDVKGIVGTKRWVGPNGYETDMADDGPLFCADVDASEKKGIVFDIYGGTFMGSVYGAGNGHYRGYYVPEWVRYTNGPARMYRKAHSSTRPGEYGNVYRTRPMTGCVNFNIRGNSETDYIHVYGDLFGGGRECTVGQWDTFLPFSDPRRLVKGGYVHVNFGGHTIIDGNAYMGVYGEGFSEQTVLPAPINLDTFDGSTTRELEKLGDAAYGHWWYNEERQRYEPGFPEPGVVDGNYGMTGEHMMRGHMKNIEMAGDLEVTFYRDVHLTDSEGHKIIDPVTGEPTRRSWLPGELATQYYDAPNIVMNSFFLGGKCGSMTNNKVMRYVYDDPSVLPTDDPYFGQTEEWGTIYRVSLPAGLTLKDKVVMGSEDATLHHYPYTADYTGFITTEEVEETDPETGSPVTVTRDIEPQYTFVGGMVTQTPMSFDAIVYNDYKTRNLAEGSKWAIVVNVPDEFYTSAEYASLRACDAYTLMDGTEIHRYTYNNDDQIFPNFDGDNHSLSDRIYSLAVTYMDDNPSKPLAYVGERETREYSGEVTAWKEKSTVVKLTASNKFEPQFDCKLDQYGNPDPAYLPEGDKEGLGTLYGGLIYGGCFNSGLVMGDVILNVGSDLLGSRLTDDNYAEWKSLTDGHSHNLGRVFGGGYGADTTMDGDIYINLLRNVRAMHVFGGGLQGTVAGQTQINYIGTEASAIYGAIYGGGFHGSIGTPGVTQRGTLLDLVSGNVARVYGGSLMGDIYGCTYVRLSDRITEGLSHLDYRLLVELDNEIEDWSGSRLVAGNVFGGNDLAGRIYTIDPALDTSTDKRYSTYSTTVQVYEEPDDTEHGSTGDGSAPGKNHPWAVNGYSGFPLVGRIYAGSNGNYGVHDAEDQHYSDGEVIFSTGTKSQTYNLSLGSTTLEVPHVNSARLLLQGGTVVNAYGGADMSTVTGSTEINVDYNDDNVEARAGFEDRAILDRLWNVFKLESQEQQTEIITEAKDTDGNTVGWMFKYQIYRLFGGNNYADMSIQPTWNLSCGHVGSVYSGGNFGRMTYFNPEGVVNELGERDYGLRIMVDSDDIFIDNVYGGARVGDIDPAIPHDFDTSANRVYGTSVTVDRGVINNVYGGNDVSGSVHFGTKVEINGAISGNVYCAGNGNYRYKYDPTLSTDTKIREMFDDTYGGRYFLLPRRVGYGGETPLDAQKVLAINAYRPNVEQAYLRIAGNPTGGEGGTPRMAYVFGKVFCGGNSSTVFYDENRADVGNIRFEIGSHVTLNSVFMGSNGQEHVNPDLMSQIEQLNDFDLAMGNELGSADEVGTSGMTGSQIVDQMKREIAIASGLVDEAEIAAFNVPNLYGVTEANRYPRLLDLYVHAVDVNALPESFKIKEDITDAYIGDFFVGGNHGSMLTDKTIEMTLPEDLVVFGKVVGGSNQANITYKGLTHIGGLTRPLHAGYDKKLHLAVKSRFEPWRLTYQIDDKVKKVKLEPDVIEADGQLMFSAERCMVLGGCYNSGRTVGDVQIDLYSDLVHEYDPAVPADQKIAEALAAKGISAGTEGKISKARAIVNGIDGKSYRSFGVVGGGYGKSTEVLGNIDVNLLPGKADYYYREGVSAVSPSAATLFGGSQEGSVVGNITVRLRDGRVLTNLYGGSEAAPVYGSTQILVGWPKYYVSNTRKYYGLTVTDDVSKPMRAIIDNDEDALHEWTNEVGNPTYAVRRRIALRPGDIVSCEVYDRLEDDDKASNFTLVDTDTPTNYRAYNSDRSEYTTPLTWDDIDICVGDDASRKDNDAEYLGHGNIYGGGFVSNNNTVSAEEQMTVRRFDENHCLDPDDVNTTEPRLSYGGNSTILIWDNWENADPERAISPKGAAAGSGDGTGGALIRDHISVSTSRYVPVAIYPGKNIKGLYLKDGSGRFVHQAPHRLTEGDPLLSNTYYELEADGGIYGGGRKVFVEGYRTCDLAYYGYAGHTPQFPMLINTAQRLDIFTVTDCCVMFNGAKDFSTNGVDADIYSLTRIGELKMTSSLPADADLDAGVRSGSEDLFNIIHDTPRTRNYLSLFNNVHYLSSITSNVLFTDKYHGANGKVGETGDYLVDDENHKEFNNPDIYDGSVDGLVRPSADAFSYNRYKSDRITYYYANRDTDIEGDGGDPDPAPARRGESGSGESGLSDGEEPLSHAVKARLAFDQRNVGTAANMIGINNGYVLKIQGAVTKADRTENVYFGPATGVFEVKLLTLAENEGGGYIYALNHHDDPNNFLETTGNFVFPGAAYLVSSDEDERYNYIYDDCFPMGRGWEYYYGPGTSGGGASSAPSTRRQALSTGASVPVEAGHGDTNQLQEVHYWYVNGTNFHFNVTMTAYTNLENEEFHIDNTDALIYLYGLEPTKIHADGSTEPGTDIYIKSVTWERSGNVEPDLTFTDASDRAASLPYSLYLSIDDMPARSHSLTENGDYAFVSPVSRADYTQAEGTIDPAASLAATVNNYSESYDSEGNLERSNTPLVGLTLYDNINDYGASTRAYYNDHLAEDEKVTIEIAGGPFTYYVNLTIKYLLGPTITGEPAIENCALPGEYIYVNSYGVNVDLDEANMTVSERNWYLMPPGLGLDDNDLREWVADIKATGSEHKDHPLLDLSAEKAAGSDRLVHIPAMYYMNGWLPLYEIVANNQSFFLWPGRHATDAELEAREEREKHLVVHNYHRMRPWDGSSIQTDAEGSPVIVDGKSVPRLEDIKLTAGARVYIEDDADMARFYDYIRSVQTPNSERPGSRTVTGLNIDPQYGDSIHFHLMADVKMPTLSAAELTAIRDMTFAGIWHGNGYTIDMGKSSLCFGRSSGEIYDTGYLSTLDGADSEAISEMTGKMMNCFMFNPEDTHHGNLIDTVDINPATGQPAEIVNCYQTSELPAGVVGYVNRSYLDEVYNGTVAYNLNSFYLRRRYNLATAHADGNYMQPLNDIYDDGEYRYARRSTNSDPAALRTAVTPNYHDYLGIRSAVTQDAFDGTVTGQNASMHNASPAPDTERGYTFDTDGEITSWRPCYPDDYLFFGQDLSANKNHPTGITDDNRVYRTSGFYGFYDEHDHDCDHGFHFNRNARIWQPELSAVDFAGYRDYQNGDTYLPDNVAYTTHKQHVFFPPMLDLPDKVASLTVDDSVTRNLLIYYHPTTETVEVESVEQTVVTDPVSELLTPYTADTPETDIRYHLIDAPKTPAAPRTALLHLIDKEAFDCPIAFDVTKSAWLTRLPEAYSSGDNAWETLCLPFTVRTTYASAYDQTANAKRNHGELSHFYGPGVDLSVEAPSHEYWLRKFTGVSGDKIWFTRPASEEDAAANPGHADETRDYFYLNTYFTDVFSYFQGFDSGHVPDQYTAGKGVTYTDYPMITMREPYIMAYPGPRFYEFDLSGEFYVSHVDHAVLTPQTISYRNDREDGEEALTIPVTATDGYPLPVVHDGYTLQGTFVPVKVTTSMGAIPRSGYAEEMSMFSAGATQTVEPFRAYLTKSGGMMKSLRICSRNVDYIGGQGDEEEEDPEDTSEGMAPHLEVYTSHGNLIVVSPFEEAFNLPLYDTMGRTLRILHIEQGENVYGEIEKGVYIVDNQKIFIR